MKMKVAVIGASGYSGAELVRLLSKHREVDLTEITSRQLAGQPASAVFPDLRGVNEDLIITDSDVSRLSATNVELFFLALPHGVAHQYASLLLAAGKKVIDLSADFRLSNGELYEEFYGEHPQPELLSPSNYQLAELADHAVLESLNLIASPGCYPTSILIPLIPLAKAGLLQGDSIIVNSVSGVSGAGKKLAETYLFCERNESVKAYGIPKHRHLSEIEEQLGKAFGEPIVIQFTPHLVPMNRGIASTIVVDPQASATVDQAYKEWENTYNGCPFVSILPIGQTPDTAHVVNTNRLEMSVAEDPRTNRWIITSCIDNLLKGASGQAVQLMNLKFGFDETEGLLP